MRTRTADTSTDNRDSIYPTHLSIANVREHQVRLATESSADVPEPAFAKRPGVPPSAGTENVRLGDRLLDTE